jgi:hypothetical protein
MRQEDLNETEARMPESLLLDFAHKIQQVIDAGHKEYGETAVEIYKALGPPAAGYAIVEKGIRYGKQGNPLDLVKAATYAYLAWRACNESRNERKDS